MDTLDKPDAPRPAIRDKPLPQAASPLQDQLTDQLFGKGFLWFIFVVFAAFYAVIEWIHYLYPRFSTLGTAMFVSVIALVIFLIAAIKIPRVFRQARMIKQGIRGEVHISHYLTQSCIPLGYRLFDDIPATGTTGNFNIDHLLIGPAGIFSIETKNWSLPPAKNGRAEITVNADTLQKSDGTSDTHALPQARNNADYIRHSSFLISVPSVPSVVKFPRHPQSAEEGEEKQSPRTPFANTSKSIRSKNIHSKPPLNPPPPSLISSFPHFLIS